MKHLLEFKTNSGETILFEVHESKKTVGELPVAKPKDVIEKAKSTLDEALQKIKPMATAIYGALCDLDADETAVEFGVKLDGEAGIVFASAGVEVHYVVKLTWKDTNSRK